MGGQETEGWVMVVVAEEGILRQLWSFREITVVFQLKYMIAVGFLSGKVFAKLLRLWWQTSLSCDCRLVNVILRKALLWPWLTQALEPCRVHSTSSSGHEVVLHYSGFLRWPSFRFIVSTIITSWLQELKRGLAWENPQPRFGSGTTRKEGRGALRLLMLQATF